MRKNKVIKSVSFNITNDKDQEYLDRIKDVNFSGYVKQLIDADIKKRKELEKNVVPKLVRKTSNGGMEIVF